MSDEVESLSACVRVTVSGLPKKDGGHVCLSSTRLHELPEKRAEKGRIDWHREGPSLLRHIPDGETQVCRVTALASVIYSGAQMHGLCAHG